MNSSYFCRWVCLRSSAFSTQGENGGKIPVCHTPVEILMSHAGNLSSLLHYKESSYYP